jgi:hypothetical protein
MFRQLDEALKQANDDRDRARAKLKNVRASRDKWKKLYYDEIFRNRC